MLIAMTRTTRLVPFRGHETWVQITAPDDAREGALPLFVLHGGPGMAHNYVRNIAELAAETGRTVIHYDQIGCGNSTHLPDAPADFWTPDLFVDEFHTVREALEIDEYHLLGQSWGGMLSAEIAVRQPSGLASLAICNSPASMELWMAGCAELRAQLPAETQAALDPPRGGGHRHRPGVPAGDQRVLPPPPMPRRPDATGPHRHDHADGGRADGLPHHERPQRVLRARHAAWVDDHRPARLGSPHRRWSSPASSTRPPPPRGSPTSSTSPTREATCSPTPATAHTWRSPKSSAPSSPPSSPATIAVARDLTDTTTRQDTFMDGQRTLESFGYKPRTPPLGLHRRPRGLRPGLHGSDRAVGDLRHRLQQRLGHGPAGVPHRPGGHGVHRAGVRADGQILPAGGIGLLLRRPRNPPRRRVFRRLGHPAGLPADTDAAVRVRRRVDDRSVPRHATMAVGDRVRRREHADQPARRRFAEDGQPGFPGHRDGLRGDLRGHRDPCHQRRQPAQRRLEPPRRSGTQTSSAHR